MVISMEYVVLAKNGGIWRKPVSDGLNVKSIVARNSSAVAVYPTSLTQLVSGGKGGYVNAAVEVKFNLFKDVPDKERQCGSTKLLLGCLGAERAYSLNLRESTNRVAVVKTGGIYLEGGDSYYQANKYRLFDREEQLAADAIITQERSTALIVYSADCPTAFLHDEATGTIGVLHSMGKGFLIEEDGKPAPTVMEETIRTMNRLYGVQPGNIQVVIFPSIGMDEYCERKEFAKAFAERNLGRFVHEREGCEQPHIDLQGAMREVFIRCGVRRVLTAPFTTADYGLQSLRGSARSSKSRRLVRASGGPLQDGVAHKELLTDEEEKKAMVRSSTYNLLVAMLE